MKNQVLCHELAYSAMLYMLLFLYNFIRNQSDFNTVFLKLHALQLLLKEIITQNIKSLQPHCILLTLFLRGEAGTERRRRGGGRTMGQGLRGEIYK